MVASAANSFWVFLGGDVMTGRGIDQILPSPGDPRLQEACVSTALDYVELAERANGPLTLPAGYKHIWGETLLELQRMDFRIINLETSITARGEPWYDKGIHYRMHPGNVKCLTVAGIDGCSLANNHVMDWGYVGLADTIETLDRAGIVHVGAGCNEEAAGAPACLEKAGKRLWLSAIGWGSSGIPAEWRACPAKPGVNLLPALWEPKIRQLGAEMRAAKKEGEVAIASIHWGGNWGYSVPDEHVAFAHALIEEGFDIIHGHSSHHVKGIEVFRERLILYGCGDFINDYEGISGMESYRGDLHVMFQVQVENTGRVLAVRLIPWQTRRFQLHRAGEVEAQWLCALLNRLGTPFGTKTTVAKDASLHLVWPQPVGHQ